MSDLQKKLQDYDPQLPTSWRPRPGSIITGTVLRYDRGESAYGPRWICVIEDEESGEPVSVWLSHKVLLSELKVKRPKPGERIGIRRLDDAWKGYARYAVIVEGRTPEQAVPDFEELPEPGDVPPDEAAEEFTGAALVGPNDGLPF